MPAALVSEQVRGSGGTGMVEALRAAVASHFESVYVHADTSIPSGYYLEPQVRPELVEGLRPGDDLPLVALALGGKSQAGNLTGTGVPT